MEGMEQHRVLIVILSLTLFVAIVLGAGLWLFYPRADEPEVQLADLDDREEGRPFDPIEYLRGDEEEPLGLEPEDAEEPEDEIIIVYGETDEEGAAPEERVKPEEAMREEGPRIVEERRVEPAAEPADRDAGAVTDERRPAAPVPARDAPPDEDAEPAPAERAAERVAARRPRAGDGAKAAEPRIVTRKEYWIQVISSPSLDTVEQAKQRLREWTISGLITSITNAGLTYYRLRIGPYTERAEAEKFLEWVRRIEGFGTSYISLVYSKRAVAN